MLVVSGALTDEESLKRRDNGSQVSSI